MKKLLAIITLLYSLNAYAQDTVVAGDNIAIGKVLSINNGLIVLMQGNTNITFSIHNISRLSISNSNDEKKKLETAYLDYITANPKNPDLFKYTEPKQVTLNAGQYLKRGANRQLVGFVATLITGIAGGVMTYTLNNKIPGIIVVGAGTIFGITFGVMGIADYRSAGILLK